MLDSALAPLARTTLTINDATFAAGLERMHPRFELVLDPCDRALTQLDGMRGQILGHKRIPRRPWYTGFDSSIAFSQ